MTRAVYTAVLVAMLFGWSLAAEAQTYHTMQMVRPVATGAAGTGLDASNRVYRAYQGIPYEIHADAHGGRWPFTYRLSGTVPSGMTIEQGPCTTIGPTCTAGTITWTPSSSGTFGPITVTVRDVDGREVNGTWSIVVSTTIGADGFCFLDAVSGNDTTGAGSLAAPYQTLPKAHTSCGARAIMYLKNGTYAVGGGSLTNPSDCRNRYIWSESSQPAIWVGYPGHTPTINFGSTGAADGACIKISGANMWFDHLQMDNVGSIGFQLDARTNGYGAVIRHVQGLDLLAGADSLNSSFFMWVKYSEGYGYFDTVQNSDFRNISTGAVALKVYTTHTPIFETSRYGTMAPAAGSDAIIALKVMARDFELRGNIGESDTQTFIGGNMNRSDSPTLIPTRGKIFHNLSLGSDTGTAEGHLTLTAALINSPEEIQVFRNTFVGGQMLFY